MHGDLPRPQREAALHAFRSGEVRVLLVSDVAARGLDIPQVDAVVNLETPDSAVRYAHR